MSCISNSSDINQTFIIEPLAINDIYTTGATLINNIIYFNRTDALSAYTANLNSLVIVDTYVTGLTFNNNYLTITRNDGVSLTTQINSLTGLTVNGSVSGTTFFGDGSNLTGISTQDTYVTGATYSNNRFTYTNNTGGTFNVLFNTLTGLTVNGNAILSGLTTVYGDSPTSAAINPGINNSYDLGSPSYRWREIFTTNIDATNVITSNSLYATYNIGVGNDLTVSGNTSLQDLTATTISATTYYGLPLDIHTTGMTFNVATYDLTIKGNDGIDYTQNLGILATDMTITGGTYNINTGVVTFTNNTGGTFSVTGFTSGMTDSYTVSANLSGETIEFNNNLQGPNFYNVSLTPLLSDKFNISGGTITGATSFTNGLTANTISATTYSNLPTDIRVTGGTYSNGTSIFTNNTGGTFSVSGFSTPFTGGTVNGATNFTAGLTANTFSATTINGTNLYVTGGTQSLFSGNSSTELLKIIQSGSGDAFVVQDQANGDASHFVINASGNTAIGLTQPLGNDKLTVSGNTSIYGTLYATSYQNLPVSVINTSSLFSTGLSNTGLNASGVTYSIFLGVNAGNGATNAYNSTFLNENAGRSASNAYHSNFIGQQAGFQATNANLSNFLGLNAGQGATNAQLSNFLGNEAGYNATSASYSNLFGYQVGKTFSGNNIGANNIIIGKNISLPNATTNAINIGGVLFGINTYSNSSGNPFTGASSTGRIGINVVTPTEALHVSGNTIINGNLTASTVSATTYFNLPIDIYTTGLTFNPANYDLKITRNDGTILTQNLAILATDMTITGGTYNSSTGIATFTNNTGGTFNVSGFLTGMTDTYTTGFTYNDNTLTIKRNVSQPDLSVSINTMTGLTVNGGLISNTISATTYYNLPTDIYTTGGTYSNGSTTFTNNTGGTFSVTGYVLSNTFYDSYVGNRLGPTETSSNGFFVDKSVNESIGYFARNGDNIGNGALASIGVLGNGGLYDKGISINFVNNGYYIPYLRNTGFLYSDVNLKVIGADLDFRTGGLITSTSKFAISSGGTLSIGIQPTLDNTITDILGRKSDGTVVRLDKSAITTTDIYTTGFTYNSANTLTLTNNTGGTLTTDINTMTGLTINGDLISTTVSATTYYNLPTDVYTTGGTYNSGTAIFTNNTGGTFSVTGFSTSTATAFTGGTVTGATNFTAGLTANTISATTYFNLPTDIRVTGGTYSNGSTTFTNNTGGTFSVTGFTIPFTGGTVTGATNFTGGLTANTISATTYFNLPTDIRVTGATYSNNTFTYTNNTGGTFNTLFNTVTGLTVNGNLTVTGNTSMTGTLSVTGNTNVRAITGTSATISGSGSSILTVIGSGTTTPIFSVQGSSGELFSVTDSLTGSLFSVNDISGLPIVEVFSDNTILMGNYLAPSLNTTAKISLTAGTNTIYSIPTSAYTGAFIDYTVINSANTSARAGNIMTIWNSGSTQYTEVSTNDIGSTTGITFSTSLSGSNALISASATTAGWTLKTIIRAI